MTARTQADNSRDEKGLFVKGNTPKTGFHTNPERRGKGFWSREDTPRFKLEQMMKLGDADLQYVIEDPQTPTFERKIAQAIQQGQWREIKEMIEQVYGKAKESVDINNPDGSMTPTVRIIDSRISSDE